MYFFFRDFQHFLFYSNNKIEFLSKKGQDQTQGALVIQLKINEDTQRISTVFFLIKIKSKIKNKVKIVYNNNKNIKNK